MNIQNKLIFISLLISCSSDSETPVKQETKLNICLDLKEIFCQKLFECDDVSSTYCNSIASLDRTCEDSKASIEKLNICRDMLYDARCSEGVPQYCKNLQSQ